MTLTFVFFGLLSVVALGGIVTLLYRHTSPRVSVPSRMRRFKLPNLRSDSLKRAAQSVRANAPSGLPARLSATAKKRMQRSSFVRESKQHSLKGIELQQLRSSVDSEDFWIRLISSDPENAHLYKKLGEYYLRNNQRKNAHETFQYAARLAPADVAIQKHLEQLK
jgi:predicted Zn-dependent protease